MVILIGIGMFCSADMIHAQEAPFSEAGDQYERIYPAPGIDVVTSAVIPNGSGHVMLCLEILQDTTEERLIITFLDFKGTISNSIEITYDSTDVEILEAGDIMRLSDDTFVFSAILDKDSLNKAVTRIDALGNVAWTHLVGQETDTRDLRRSNSVLVEIPGEKIWHAHIIDGLGSTTELQITEFEFDGTINFVRTLNLTSDNNIVLDEDLFEMAVGIDSTIMLLGSSDDPGSPFFLSNLDTTATVNWTRGYNGNFGRDLDTDGYDIIQLMDTTWVVTGSVLGSGVQRNQGFMMRVSNEGERLQTMTFSQNSTQFQIFPNGVVELMDSTITLSMTREDMVDGSLNPLIVNFDLVDSSFNYQTVLDTVSFVEPRFSELVTTDSISMSYLTTSASNTDNVPYITKVDGLGNTQCQESSDLMVVDSVEFSETPVQLTIEDQDIVIDSIDITILPYGRFQPPVLTINDTTFCPQDPIVYVVDATVDGGTEYIWEDDSTDPVRLITEEGMFSVTVTVEEDLCFKLCDTINVTQLDPPMVSIGKSSTGFCITGDIILTANQTGSAAESILWSTGETTVSITVPGIEGDSYSVMTVDGCELTADASTTIDINDLIPPVEGEIEFSCGNPGLLTAVGTGFGSLLWSTGDTTRLLNITEPDVYTLTLFDACGEPAVVDEITISAQDLDDCTTCDNPCLTWPNALHPANADPENQVFGPVIRNGCENLIEDYELQIYNRWGKSIFTSNDVNVTWNGAINGSNQPGGVYYYWARYSDGTTTCERRGDMTLLR